MADVLDFNYRTQVLNDIDGNENKLRKNESLRRWEIYQKRQAPYIGERLRKEFSKRTVDEMRTITSINLTRRIIDCKASLYKEAPERVFSRTSGKALSDNELKQITSLYDFGRRDVTMKQANKKYKLQEQCAIQLIPKGGVIAGRVLLPHHFDVIPWPDQPEEAMAYVISVYDKSLLLNTSFVRTPGPQGDNSNYLPNNESDNINQTIGDPDDYKSKQRFIWWTADWNFITDGRGHLLDQFGNQMITLMEQDLIAMQNPIGMLPFVDVATDKEFEFWIRQGNDVVDFNVDFSIILSDTAEINKRQGYSQAIIYSEKPPADMIVGPNRILHIPQDPNKETQPRFEWSTPSPDMQASLQLLETYLRLFLSAEGLDPKTITGSTDIQRFSSGIERLLALVEKFEASRDDIDLFQWVEDRALKITAAWSNIMQGANIKVGVDPLISELQNGILPDDMVVETIFAKPEMIQTKDQVEESVVRRMENGLLSRMKALMILDDLTEEQAVEEIKRIDSEEKLVGDMDGESTEGQI